MNRDDFQRFFEMHHKRAFSYFRRSGFSREDAKDLTQEAFLRVWNHRDQYQGGGWSYLKEVVRTVGINELRRRKAIRRGAPTDSLDEPESSLGERLEKPLFGLPPASPEGDALHRQTRRNWSRAISTLDPVKQQALRLRFFGLSYQEIAEVMERSSQNAVKMLLRDARAQLFRVLKVLGEDDER